MPAVEILLPLTPAEGHLLDLGKIVSVTFVTFIISRAPIHAHTSEGFVCVDERLIYLLLVYQGTPAQILLRLPLANALPDPLPGIRISAGFGILGATAGASFTGSTRAGEGGLGDAIIYASNSIGTACLFFLGAAAKGARASATFSSGCFSEWLALHHSHPSCQSQTAD